MRTVGIIATVIVVCLAVVAVGIGVRSIPDVKRYLAMRRM